MSIFFVPQRCSTKTEELSAERRIEEAKEPLQDLEADSLGKEDAASREFSSCHMTSTERLEARLGLGRPAATHNLLQGTTDTSYMQEKRTTLGSVRSLEELDGRLENLTSNPNTILEHVKGNLKVVLMGAGYTVEDAKRVAHQSPFLRISGTPNMLSR
jgi:hypothetical protein